MKIKNKAARALSGGKYIKKMLALVPLLVVAFWAGGCSNGGLVRLTDGKSVEVKELADELKGADIVFVGEHHDDKAHHRKQLEVITTLHEAGIRVAVGLEMFKADDQEKLDMWVAGKMKKEDFIDAYYSFWNIPWSQYGEIFLFAREKGIPLVGLNISKAVIHQVFEKGFDSLTPDQLAKMPGVSCDIDQEYEAFIRKAMGRHRNDSDEAFKSFCEAQMVWDTAMAHRAVEYLKATPGRTLIILSGTVHSWKRGIPAQVRKRSDYKSIVILPESSDKLRLENITIEDADYVWPQS